MGDEMVQQMVVATEKLAGAVESLERVLGEMNAEQASLRAKVDRIVAALEEGVAMEAADSQGELQEETPADAQEEGLKEKVEELQKVNAELKAQSARMARKTLSPMVSALLGKNDGEVEHLDGGAIDKTLQTLSIEQRIAVKAEMARAGMIE